MAAFAMARSQAPAPSDPTPVIERAALVNAAISAVVSPVPLVDEVLLAHSFALLARRIGRMHGLTTATVPWRPIGISAAKGLLARGVVNITVAFIPGVDAVAN